MSDIPVRADKEVKNLESTTPDQKDKIQVTHENADLLAVHLLSQIHGRLGYIIKLLEKKNG